MTSINELTVLVEKKIVTTEQITVPLKPHAQNYERRAPVAGCEATLRYSSEGEHISHFALVRVEEVDGDQALISSLDKRTQAQEGWDITQARRDGRLVFFEGTQWIEKQYLGNVGVPEGADKEVEYAFIAANSTASRYAVDVAAAFIGGVQAYVSKRQDDSDSEDAGQDGGDVRAVRFAEEQDQGMNLIMQEIGTYSDRLCVSIEGVSRSLDEDSYLNDLAKRLGGVRRMSDCVVDESENGGFATDILYAFEGVALEFTLSCASYSDDDYDGHVSVTVFDGGNAVEERVDHLLSCAASRVLNIFSNFREADVAALSQKVKAAFDKRYAVSH